MLKKSKAIVLSQIKYGDNSVIVKMFLDKAGVQSFMVKGINKAKSKIAYFQPLSLLEIDYQDSNSNLKFIKEQRFFYVFENINTNLSKNCIFIFLAEILNKSLRTEEIEPDFFQYIVDALMEFDKKKDKFNDFHLFFLVKMMFFLGFMPKFDEDFAFFDIKEGKFTALRPLHQEYLSEKECSLLKEIIIKTEKYNFDDFLDNKTRSAMLNHILHYYNYHILDFSPIKSQVVLSRILR
jgi:DNA repair protein RecO (recombination protein O)